MDIKYLCLWVKTTWNDGSGPGRGHVFEFLRLEDKTILYYEQHVGQFCSKVDSKRHYRHRKQVF